MNMNDQISDIHNAIIGDEKRKKTKLEKKIKISKSKKKKGYVAALILKENGSFYIENCPIVNSTIRLKSNDFFYLASSNYVWDFNGNPSLIVPEWDMKPLSKERLQGLTDKDGTWATPQKILIHFMNLSQVENVKKGSKLAWIIIAVVLVVGVYLVSKMFT